MTFDLEILRQLGWSETLIEATARSLESTPRPIATPVASVVVDPLDMTVTTDAIEVRDDQPIGTQEIVLR
jgi:hypothetical protein